MADQRPSTTTDAGIPVPSDEHALTVGPGGPVLLQDYYLNEKLAHFVRERVPDRVWHLSQGVDQFIAERAASQQPSTTATPPSTTATVQRRCPGSSNGSALSFPALARQQQGFSAAVSGALSSAPARERSARAARH